VDPPSTESAAYTGRLADLEQRWIRRVFDVQAPYRWNLRRLELGFVLDVGCGLGRNLGHVDGHGVGVDHNAHSVEVVRSRGMTAFTPEEFLASEYAVPGRFDSLLSAHVLEHLEWDDAVQLVQTYLPYVRAGGKVVMICPQRAGFRSDATHVTELDGPALERLAGTCGVSVRSTRSFPFPRVVGNVFTYNETVVVGEKPA
jgi:2-polyprenyl-3-methyl-5-hydroxy-6-metoxy-1,4-benzoquinol methylase